MARKPLSIKTALAGIAAVAAGSFGAMAAINRLVARRAAPTQPAAPQSAAAAGDAQIVVARAPAGQDMPPRPAHVIPELRSGWVRVEHTALPEPTYWPAVLALAITFLAWGLVTSLVISGVGLVLFVVALAGWIGALRHGH
jgi:hypothetical protein